MPEPMYLVGKLANNDPDDQTYPFPEAVKRAKELSQDGAVIGVWEEPTDNKPGLAALKVIVFGGQTYLKWEVFHLEGRML